MNCLKITFLNAFFFCILLAVSQNPHKNYIVIDNLEENDQKWYEGTNEKASYVLENGTYKIDIKDSINWNVTKSYNEQSIDHFFLDVDIKKYSGNRFGIMFAGKNNQNAYVFCWKTSKVFQFIKTVDSKDTKLFESKWPEKLKEVKTVEISVKNKLLSVLVNGSTILEDQLIEPMGRSFGFSVQKGVLVIDKLAIGNWTTDVELVEDWELYATPVKLPESINSAYIELVPVVSTDGKELYFTRRDDPGNFGTEGKDDIFHVLMQENGTWGEAKRLGMPLNNKDANYVCSIAENGKTLLIGNKYRPDSTCSLGVSTTTWDGTKWTFPKTLNIKNYYNESKNQEFFLSADAKVLVMTLQRKDSKGQKDLYVSFLSKDGSWTEPKNMGSVLNTSTNELSPFLSTDGNKLYFSSYGHPGYGSADIFVSEKLDETYLNWSKPKNLGPKINSIGFDAYFSTTEDLTKAYLVKSNPKTKQDIYEITLKAKETTNADIRVFGYTRTEKSKSEMSVEVKIRQGNSVFTVKSDENGFFELMVKRNLPITFEIEQLGYFKLSETLDVSAFPHFKEKRKDLMLKPIEKGSSVVLNNIIFFQGTAKIVETSFEALDEIFSLMNKYPTLEAELWGHTEKIGDENLNLGLSEKRAIEIKKYLVGKGVSENRLTTKGFGSSRPISQTDREKNRRVEFVIIKK